MATLKNKIHSELYKRYSELKQKITSAQHMLGVEKADSWDKWCFCEKWEFEKLKALNIKHLKKDLKELHKECKELKRQIWQTNQAYQRESLLDKMHDIADKIINKI